MSTSKAAKKVTKLSDSLDALEAQLEPLLSQSLVETAAGLETLQEAKLHTLLPYLINDLIFSELKSVIHAYIWLRGDSLSAYSWC
jgi:exosome complex protein LRP1